MAVPNIFANGTTADAALVNQDFSYLDGRIDAAIAPTPTVTSLPSSPADGQRVYYVADPAQGTTWHLRYRAASTSSYKWEFVGGTGLYSASTGVVALTGGVPTATGASVTTLLAGTYDIQVRAQVFDGAVNDKTLYLSGNGLNASDPVSFINGPVNVYVQGVTRVTMTTTGTVSLLASASTASNVQRALMWVTPVRVG